MTPNLPALPAGWEWKKLADICKLYQPSTITSKEISDTGLYKVYGANGVIGFYDKYNHDDIEVLITCRGATCGTINISEAKSWVNGNAMISSPKEYNLDKYFIAYALKNTDLTKAITGSAQPQITRASLSPIEIPLPPLDEQKRLVSLLDTLFAKIDRSIELLSENITASDALLPSALNTIFGDMEALYKKEKLAAFDKKMSAGGTPLRAKNEYWDNGTIEWFSSGELNQQFTLPAKERITEEGLKNSSAKLFSKGTLLIGMYDTAAMKMSILHTDGSCNQAIVGIKPNEDELNIFFLMYQLEYLKPRILEERQGVRQQNLNLSKIKNIEIEYPPLDIQTQTVAYLDSIRHKVEILKHVQNDKIANLKALKASILDRAFKGEL